MYRLLHLNLLDAEFTSTSEHCTLTLVGQLTGQDIEPLRSAMAAWLAVVDADVAVDVGELSFVSINGLGLLVWLAAQVQRRGHRLHLLHIGAHLCELLQLTRLDRVLAYDDTPCALMAA